MSREARKGERTSLLHLENLKAEDWEGEKGQREDKGGEEESRRRGREDRLESPVGRFHPNWR
jgi:hypothetical protein